MIKLNKILTMILSIVFVSACTRWHDDNTSNAPPPDQTTEQSTKKEDDGNKKPDDQQSQQAQNKTDDDQSKTADDQSKKGDDQRKAGDDQSAKTQTAQLPKDQQVAQTESPSPTSAPPPAERPAPVANSTQPAASSQPSTMAALIDPHDKVTHLFTRFLTTEDPATMDKDGDGLVHELLVDEDEMPVKVVELQATIGKLSRTGMYPPPVKDRVALLQGKLNEEVKTDENIGAVKTGFFFLATGAVLGGLRGANVYQNVPYLAKGARDIAYAGGRMGKNGIKKGSLWVYNGARENLNKEGFAKAKGAVTSFVQEARTPAETLVRNNIADLNLSEIQNNFVARLTPLQYGDLPSGTKFIDTPKAGLRFAVLDHSPDFDPVPLGDDMRIIVFRQSRTIRGRLFDSLYVTEMIPTRPAEIIASSMRLHLVEPPERQFVSFFNSRTGTATSTRWRWADFKNMLDAGSAKVQPLFASFNTPAALRTGLLTTTALTVGYHYGYDTGRNSDQTNFDLESMVKPEAAAPEGK